MRPRVNMFEIPVSTATPQPAVVIGVGRFGAQICERLREQAEIYDHFQSPLSLEYAKIVATTILPDQQNWDMSADELRQTYLNDSQILLIAQQVMATFNKIRLHRRYPLVDTVRPTMYLIGATWSDAGCALLWPLARLIRNVLGEHVDCSLVGIFVAANSSASIDDQVRGDALTYQLLAEGEQFATWSVDHQRADSATYAPRARSSDQPAHDESSLAWVHQIDRVLPAATAVPPHIYDHIYLIDSLKANNTTIEFNNNVYEVTTVVTTLIEALLYSGLPLLVDQAVLDDFAGQAGQIYIGVGTSALVVPLHQIADKVARYTVGALIKERLLQPPQSDDGLDEDTATRLASQIRRSVAEHQLSQCDNLEVRLGQQQLSSGHVVNHSLNGKLAPTNKEVIINLRIRGDDLASARDNLNEVLVLNRLSEEQNLGQRLVYSLQQDLEQSRQQQLRLVEHIAGDAVGRLLRAGGKGLMRAIVITERLADDLAHQAQQIAGQLEQNEQKSRAANNLLAGTQGRFSAISLLRSAIKLQSRMPALLVRAGIIITLMTQFYWDALLQSRVFWPFTNLEARFTTAIWPVIIASVLLVVVLGTLMIGLLPRIVIQYRLRRQRDRFGMVLGARLSNVLIDDTYQIVVTLERRLRDIHLSAFYAVRQQLLEYADASMSDQGDDLLQELYLEYSVVSPQQLVGASQRKVAEHVLRQQGQRVISSWQPTLTATDDWAIRSADDVIATVTQHTQPAIEQSMRQPIDTYIERATYHDWYYRLWKSSIPWLKVSAPVATLETAEHLVELNALLIRQGVVADFATDLSAHIDQCYVLDWVDPYRILLLRMICGVRPTKIDRYAQIHLSARTQAQRKEITINANQPSDDLDPDEAASVAPNAAHAPADLQTSSQELRNAIEQISNDLDRIGFLMAIEDLTQVVLEAGATLPDRNVLLQALAQLDISLDSPSTTDETRQHLAPALRQLDLILQELGVEPVAPEPGTIYDPAIHGVAVDSEHQPDLADEAIVRRIRRGYRIEATGQLLVAPWVYVNRYSSLEKT